MVTTIVTKVVLLVVVTSVSSQITVQPGQEECFYQSVTAGHTLGVEYQVIDAGASQLAELDIDFSLVSPRGSPVIIEYRRQAASHRIPAEEPGDYKICFDNKFSYVSPKTVYFELITETEENAGQEWWLDLDQQTLEAEVEQFEMQAQDINVKLLKIRKEMVKVRHLQDQIRVTDTRDRSLAEHNYERVNTFSLACLTLILLAGLTQVLLLRSLFDEKSRINPFWKKAFKD